MRGPLLVFLLLAGCAGQEQALPSLAKLTLPRVPALSATSGAPPVSVTGVTGNEPTPRPPSGGGGSGGGGSAPDAPAVQFTVLDTADLPVASATVMLPDGRTAVSDASGAARLAGTFASGTVVVSAPGYATSIVAGLGAGATLHLRPSGAVAGSFAPQTTTLRGHVTWPSGDHQGGVAYYEDDLDSQAAPATVATDGSFAIAVKPTQPGTPHGVVLVLASDSADQTLMGISEEVSTASPTLAPIALAVADRNLNYSVSGIPAGLNRVSSQLEILESGAPPMVIDGHATAAGGFSIPVAGALPGTLRVTVSAQDEPDNLESTLSMPVSENEASGTFLPLPTFGYDTSTNQLRWSGVPGASAYYASAGPANHSNPAWEAWAESSAPLTLPTADWLSAGQGRITLEAIDAPGLGARQVASLARQLRVEPWQEQPAYRVSRRRLWL
ncbi:MAG TPA: carboxypeptidase-like regulatory domain-containing protein [Oscillatoriaceae cyanobacterium]